MPYPQMKHGLTKARTGRSSSSNFIGRFGKEERNESGARLIDLCKQNNLKITNGFFFNTKIFINLHGHKNPEI